MKEQRIFAVSGVKDSGKTTLISRLIPHFKRKGLSVSVIKHDVHDFIPDVPGTDTYRLRSAGAQGAAVFSGSRAMVIKDDVTVSEKELIREFPDADIIILEGFKYSEYPKVEVVRREVSSGPVCDPVFLLAVATDLSPEEFSGKYSGIPVYGLEEREAERLAEYLCFSAQGLKNG